LTENVTATNFDFILPAEFISSGADIGGGGGNNVDDNGSACPTAKGLQGEYSGTGEEIKDYFSIKTSSKPAEKSFAGSILHGTGGEVAAVLEGSATVRTGDYPQFTSPARIDLTLRTLWIKAVG
jgi:hypothetical protein